MGSNRRFGVECTTAGGACRRAGSIREYGTDAGDLTRESAYPIMGLRAVAASASSKSPVNLAHRVRPGGWRKPKCGAGITCEGESRSRGSIRVARLQSVDTRTFTCWLSWYRARYVVLRAFAAPPAQTPAVMCGATERHMTQTPAVRLHCRVWAFLFVGTFAAAGGDGCHGGGGGAGDVCRNGYMCKRFTQFIKIFEII